MPVVLSSAIIAWTCLLGHWMPSSGSIGTGTAEDPADFHDCDERLCLAGFYGDAPNETDSTCTGVCPPGHFCPMGSETGLPCPAGSRWPYEMARNVTDCIPCFPGSFQNGTG